MNLQGEVQTRGSISLPDINLTQAEANQLITMEKRRTDNTQYFFPDAGGRISVPLTSVDQREAFLLDVHRGRINLAKATYQNRSQKVVILVRLDIEGSPHRNPDGQDIPPPHLHVYREGYGDKWASPVDPSHFPNTTDLYISMEDFMRYCNITQPPFIEKRLF